MKDTIISNIMLISLVIFLWGISPFLTIKYPVLFHYSCGAAGMLYFLMIVIIAKEKKQVKVRRP